MNANISLVQNKPSAEAGFSPMRMVEIEIGCPLPTIAAYDEKTGQRYRRALCLVRLHTQPLGLLELELGESGASADHYAMHIWDVLAERINGCLLQDGLPAVNSLSAAGLPASSAPRCIEELEKFFAHAPFVSVIISTRERLEHLESCLRSLMSLCYPRYEVIVVDNAPSSTATADFIRQTYYDEPRVYYIREDRPGASRARNRGIQAAKGEILAFTDDDVLVDPYWLVELVKAFNLVEDVACVTGLVLPMELETPAQVWFEEYGGFSKGLTPRIFDMKEHHPRTPLHPYTTGQFGSGVSMAFTAAFLRDIKGFDPVLGPGMPAQAAEDLTLFFQVMMRGHKLVYTPASLLYHQHRRDYTSLRRQMYNYGIGLSVYLLRNLLHNPQLLFDFVTKVPYGLYFSLSGRSPKNSKKSTTYPKELTMLELKGMLYGPFAYVHSLWQGALRRRRFNRPGTLFPTRGKGSLMC